MPRRVRGFTLSEVLIVLAIVAVVAAMAFPVYRSAQTTSKRAVTVARLKQIYQALMLYGMSYDVFDEVPGLGSVPAAPLAASNLLFEYGLTPEQLHSAAFPAEGYKRWGSSFIWYWVRTRGDDLPEAVANRQRLLEEQSRYVIVQDLNHDAFEFWPHEKKSDPFMQRRFELNLRVDGSVKAERRPGIRGVVLPSWWK